MHARCTTEPGNIGAIVHDDRGAARRGTRDNRISRVEEVTSREVLRTDLQQLRPPGQTRSGVVDERPAGPFADLRVANDVQRRKSEA
jgi:hypothetical protein